MTARILRYIHRNDVGRELSMFAGLGAEMLRGRRAQVGAALVLIAALFAPASVRAAGAATQKIPAPPSLGAVSCTSDTNCFAVGERVVGVYNRTLVKRWNGASWTAVASPNPAGKIDALLTNVSCTTPTDCIAVGLYSTDLWARTLIERWNGVKWSLVSSPNPPGRTFAGLSDVSCTTPTSCVAVGHYETSSWARTLVERWNGGGWSLMASPNPPGRTFAGFIGVDCTTATTCIAVGTYETNNWGRTLVAQWNGGGWVFKSSPNPAGQNFAALEEIDCPTATSCYAVGNVNARTLAEHWDGTHWSLQITPNPTGPRDELALGSVSCATDTDCTSVGAYFNSKPPFVFKNLIQHWNGATWSAVSSPDPTISALFGVTCVTTSSCYAVGLQISGELQKHWDGLHWSVQN